MHDNQYNIIYTESTNPQIPVYIVHASMSINIDLAGSKIAITPIMLLEFLQWLRHNEGFKVNVNGQ